MKEPIYPNYYVAIMAGGVGSRFWPGSREARPKQFLDILGVGKSLLQLTFERFLPIVPASHIFVVTHEKYRDLVKKHLPQITDNQILGEPSRNNTAPSVAYTAYKLHGINPDAVFIMAPSDHVVLYESEFMRFIHRALRFATKNDALVTLGIRPTRPDTGYGYIRYDGETDEHNAVYPVKQFTEKPNLETATHFIASGEYLWNAGIFIWSTKSLIRAFEKYAPDIAQIFEKGKSAFNTDAEKDWLQTFYPTTRSTSIDYAIMEPAKNVYTVPSAFGWSDLGTWASLHNETERNTDNNVIIGDVITDEVTNSLIRMPEGKLAILRGLDDFIIVDEEDVLLVYPKSKEQDIKKVTEQIKREKRTQYL